MARCVGRRQLEPGVGFAGLGDDVHVLPARKAHHRVVLRQAVHEQGVYAPIARMHMRAFKQRAAYPAAALSLEH